MKVLQPSPKGLLRALTLERLTLNYVAAEDRIRLVGVRKDGDAIVLWLTQRLCNQAVHSLTRVLEKLAEERGGLARNAMLAFQQSAARRSNPPSSSPITAGPAAAQALVRVIEMRQNSRRFVLAFKFGKESHAEIALTVPGLHRWLLVLHSQYGKAGWNMQAWPEWFETADVVPPALH